MTGFEGKAGIEDFAHSSYTFRVIVLRNYTLVPERSIDALFRSAVKKSVRKMRRRVQDMVD